jgi:hypothetical protein
MAARQQFDDAQQQQESTLKLESERVRLAGEKQKQEGATMVGEMPAWLENSTYQKPWSQLPQEVRHHFGFDTYGANAAEAPAEWNQSLAGRTGNPAAAAPVMPKLEPNQQATQNSDGTWAIKTVGVVPVLGDPLATGEKALEGLNGNQKTTVKALANYQLSDAFLNRLPPDEKERLIAAAVRYNPNFNEQEYKSRQALATSFKTGPDAANITSLNTVVGHIGALSEAWKALGNAKFTPYNWLANQSSKATGDPGVTNFNERAIAVESELAKLFKGTGAATDQEINAWRASLSPNLSPEQFDGVIKGAVGLMASRLNALQQKYRNGVGDVKDMKWLNFQSQAVLRKLGVKPKEMGAGDPAPSADQPEPQSQPITAPKAGEVRDGYRYKGGAPNDQSSWEAVK